MNKSRGLNAFSPLGIKDYYYYYYVADFFPPEKFWVFNFLGLMLYVDNYGGGLHVIIYYKYETTFCYNYLLPYWWAPFSFPL